MWFIIGFFIGAFWLAFSIENEMKKYGYFTWGDKYYYPEDEIRKIDKVVLDGSESWRKSSRTDVNRY